jgi:Vesicle transport v-SNARE protein N-terminus
VHLLILALIVPSCILISATPTIVTDNPDQRLAMDTDIGTELFSGYENDFNLIIADISSKLQGLQDQDGEPRKAALRAAERAVEEAEEIVISLNLLNAGSNARR